MLRPTMSSDARPRPAESIRRVAPAAWLLVAVLAATACNKNKASETESPSDAAGDASASPGGASLESLEHELATRNGELSQAADARQSAMSGGAEGAAVDHCERICSIAESICGLADAICGLADEHPDEPRYAESCTRAKSDCERANEACNACQG